MIKRYALVASEILPSTSSNKQARPTLPFVPPYSPPPPPPSAICSISVTSSVSSSIVVSCDSKFSASRFERRRPRFAAALAVVAAAAAVPRELVDAEASSEESFAVVSSVIMSFVTRRPERELVAVFSSVAARFFAGREAFLSNSSAASGHS